MAGIIKAREIWQTGQVGYRALGVDIHFKPRSATKGQAVADFLSEFIAPKDSATPAVTIEANTPSTLVHIAGEGSFDPN